MANNSIQTRFTEANYATKQEVIHELKTPLIDSFWKMIVAYRNGFAKELGVYKIERTPITYCLCPSIANKLDESESKLYSLNNKYFMVSEDGNDRFIYKKDSMIAILNEIAIKNKVEVDDNYLRMVLSNKIVNNDEKYSCLKNYLDCFEIIKNHKDGPINEDLFAELYCKLSNTTELVSLYRINEYLSDENHVIIDRLYKSAPANLIPSMMDELIDVLNNSDLPEILKAALAFYYISYVKPFDNHNEEIGLLLAKLIISKTDLQELAYSINLEKMISDVDKKVSKIEEEVQKNNDFTYFLDLFMKVLNESIEKEIMRMNNLEALSLKKEYYRESMEEAKQSPVYQQEKEENEEVVQEININPAPVISQTVHEERNLSGLAISSLPPVLDEKEAQRLEEHLLESDPELKHSQAYFYARHCTMGKRYTIGQFKKELGCAYETARTSMDALASLGYYRQEMVKNKKVYTPIKRN